MMQIEEYFSHYDSFDREFFPMATDDDVLEKFDDEMVEAQVAIDAMFSGLGTQEDLIGETLDTLNMAIKTLRMYGVKDPLRAGAEKLRATAAKYRSEGMKI